MSTKVKCPECIDACCPKYPDNLNDWDKQIWDEYKAYLNDRYQGVGFKHYLTDEALFELEKGSCYPVKQDKNITINNDGNFLPFGTKYFMWREMKECHLKRNGIIWYYDNIAFLSGRAGYILVKGEFRTGWNICTTMS